MDEGRALDQTSDPVLKHRFPALNEFAGLPCQLPEVRNDTAQTASLMGGSRNWSFKRVGYREMAPKQPK